MRSGMQPALLLFARRGKEANGAWCGGAAAMGEAHEEAYARKRECDAQTGVEEGNEPHRDQAKRAQRDSARHHDCHHNVARCVEEAPKADFVVFVGGDSVRMLAHHLREDLYVEQREHHDGADDDRPDVAHVDLSERLDAQPGDVPAGGKPNNAGDEKQRALRNFEHISSPS